MQLIGQGMPAHRSLRVQFRRCEAGAGGLDVHRQLHQLLDGLLITLKSHDLGQGESYSQGQFRLGQPAVAVMPEQPADQ